MITFIYAIFDNKADAHMPPFFCVNDQVAKRTFQSAASDPNHMFHNHPEDFTLCKLGSFDDSTGKIESTYELLYLGDL